MVLLPDGTWKFESAARPTGPVTARRKSAAATTRVQVPFGDATFWIDGSKWKEDTREAGRIVFKHTNGKYFGLLVSEGLGGIPTSAMKNVALINAKKLDPNVRAVAEERRVVNGREVMYLELDVTGQGIPFRFAGYYHGGTKSNLQVIGYTVRGEFDASKKDLEEFINGIEIQEPSSPETTADAPSADGIHDGLVQFGAVTLKFDPGTWKAVANEESGTFELNSKLGDAYAKLIVEKVEAQVDALIAIALRNMKKEDPNAREVSREDRSVGGVPVKMLRVDLSYQGIPVTFLNYYYAGKAGLVQLLTWTSQQEFAAKRPLLQSLLDGLVIRL